MKFKLRLLLSLLPFADPFADDGEARRFAELFGQKLTIPF